MAITKAHIRSNHFFDKLTRPHSWILLICLLIITSCKKEPAALITNPPPPPPPPPPVLSEHSLTPKPLNFSTHCKGFYEYLPEGYVSGGGNISYPLMIFFHGGGEVGETAAALSKLLLHGPLKLVKNGTFPKSFTVDGKVHRFIILAPQFTSSGDVYPTEVDAFIEYAKQNYRVDASRIYLTGLSYGGGNCWNYPGYSNSYANKIAAMVPIAAYIADTRSEFKVDETKAKNIAFSNLPIWSTHNSGDRTCNISWVTNAHQLLSNLAPVPNPLPRLTIFNSISHGGWSTTYDPAFKENNLNIYEWMLQYKR